MKGLRGTGTLSALSSGGGRPLRSKRSRPEVEASAAAAKPEEPCWPSRAAEQTLSAHASLKPVTADSRPCKAPRIKQEIIEALSARQPSPDGPAGGSECITSESSVSCPVCGRRMKAEAINGHLDVCLTSRKSGKQPIQQTIQFGKATPNPSRFPSLNHIPTSLGSQLQRGKAASESTEECKGPTHCPSASAPCSQANETAPSAPSGQRSLSRRRPALPREVHGWATCRALVVGRRFHRDAAAGTEGELLEVLRETTNARDTNAIQVIRRVGSSTVETLGHLPAGVAACLAGPIDAGVVEAKVVMGAVLEGASANGPLPVILCFCRRVPDSETDGAQGVTERSAEFSMDQLKLSVAEAMAEVQAKSSGVGVAPESLQSNMLAIINTVMGLEGLVLNKEETALLSSFGQLPLPAQYLFLRLHVQRKGSLFKVNSIAYKEVPDVSAAIASLEALNIVKCMSDGQQCEGWVLPDLLQVLTVPEMQSVASAIGVSTSGPRAELLQRLCDSGSPTKNPWQQMAVTDSPPNEGMSERTVRVMSAVLTSVGPILYITPNATAAFARAQRLFFQNEGQDVNSFLLADIGAIKYPEYALEKSLRSVLFASRDDMLNYEEALEQAHALNKAVEAEDSIAAEAAVKPAWRALEAGHHKVLSGLECSLERAPPLQARFRAGWVYTCMGTVGVSVLEKLMRHTEAVDMLRILLGGVCCPGRRGEWWLRLSIDLQHLGRHNDALEAAESALADEWVRAGDRTSLQRRVLRLGKPPRRWRQPAWASSASAPSCAALWEPREVVIQGRPIQRSIGVKSAFWGFDGGQTTVEGLALQYYSQEEIGEWKGSHSEGGVWSIMFSLLLWEVLFDGSVPGAFVHAFHSAPLDLGTDSFWLRRCGAIEAALRRVEDGEGPAMLRKRWAESCGRQCRGVNWERMSIDELVEIVECMGGPAVASICRLKAQDYGNWSAGMPDLVLWRPAHKDAKLVEVKGPRDRLSDQQRSWCCALTAAGVQVEICKIVEPQKVKPQGKSRRSVGS